VHRIKILASLCIPNSTPAGIGDRHDRAVPAVEDSLAGVSPHPVASDVQAGNQSRSPHPHLVAQISAHCSASSRSGLNECRRAISNFPPSSPSQTLRAQISFSPSLDHPPCLALARTYTPSRAVRLACKRTRSLTCRLLVAFCPFCPSVGCANWQIFAFAANLRRH